MVNPLQHLGSDGLKKRAEEWFASFDGQIGYQIRNLSLTAGDEVLTLTTLTMLGGTRFSLCRLRLAMSRTTRREN